MRVVLTLFLSFAALAAPLRAQAPAARVVLFVSAECPHCQQVEREVVPGLRARFGERLELRSLDIADPAHYEALMAIEDAHRVPFADRVVPVAVIGDELIAGADAIERDLADRIDRSLAQGGNAWPEALETGPQVRLPIEQSGSPIWIAYFYQTGCRDCSRAHADLEYVRARHPRVRVEEHNVVADTGLGVWLAARAGRELETPSAFVGSDALIGAELEARALERVVARYEATRAGAPRVWDAYDPSEGSEAIVSRFRELGPLAVVAAGLVDGINPCAFATLIFFVSYLSLGGRRGRAVLVAGAAFTLGVFIAYLAVGLGLYRALDALGGWLPAVGRWLMIATALLCAALAVLSFRDFLAARRGELKDMALVLPKGLQDRVHAAVRRGKGTGYTGPVAFTTGVVVSLLELACTGQVYLPTILFVTSVPELRAQAFAYLLLYNLLFILPLIVVFASVYFGTTSKQLTAWLQRRAQHVKLGLTIFFALLCAWLVVSALPLSTAAQPSPPGQSARVVGVGQAAPEIDVEWVVGRGPARLLETRGRVVVLFFFSAMCPACRDAIIVVDRQSRERPELVVVAIAEDHPRMLQGLFAERPVVFPVARDAGGTLDRYGIERVPTMLVLDRTGIVRARLVGGEGTARLSEEIGRALRAR